jgi:hypothetical protein
MFPFTQIQEISRRAHPRPATTITAPAPTRVAGKSFLSTEVDWKMLRKVAIVVLIAMTVLYVLGFCLNDGPSMNYLGWAYLTKWNAQPTHPGQIIRFVSADKPAWMKWLPRATMVKRFTGFTYEGLLMFEGDNSEWSADCRDEEFMKPVPPDHVAGVVVAAISPQRVWRSLTPEGRLRNRVEWITPPKYHKWGPDSSVVLFREGVVEIGIRGVWARYTINFIPYLFIWNRDGDVVAVTNDSTDEADWRTAEISSRGCKVFWGRFSHINRNDRVVYGRMNTNDTGVLDLCVDEVVVGQNTDWLQSSSQSKSWGDYEAPNDTEPTRKGN